MYEFSFKEAWEDWYWSERFPHQKELRDYFFHVDKKVNLRKDIQFNTKITAAHWDNESSKWRIFSEDKLIAEARFFIPCVGYASIKHVPALKGLESFAGSCHHTSEWTEDIDLANKRVGIVGTGASGLQVIETIAAEVAHLVVFQRTPNLAVPMHQKTLDREEQKQDKANYPSRFKLSEKTFTGKLEISYTRKFSNVL